MLWDKTHILPVDASDQARALLFWCALDHPPAAISRACDLAAIDIMHTTELAACLAIIARRKPDLLVHDLALTAGNPDFAASVVRHRSTASLPLLAYHCGTEPQITPAPLTRQTSETDAFLTIRSFLRRDRPVALNSSRQNGVFILDEVRFTLGYGDALAKISKADLCMLGPFFDLADVVFDRPTLARLALSATGATTWSIDRLISRTRRNVKTQLGIDPLRSVRGIGYALAAD